MQVLGIDDALAIASLVLDMDPRALVGATKLGPLDSALHAPFAGYGDVELYPEPWQKCAILGSRICRCHPFPDGSERVAFLAMRAFARINGAINSVRRFRCRNTISTTIVNAPPRKMFSRTRPMAE